jgi:hypothetical protein
MMTSLCHLGPQAPCPILLLQVENAQGPQNVRTKQSSELEQKLNVHVLTRRSHLQAHRGPSTHTRIRPLVLPTEWEHTENQQLVLPQVVALEHTEMTTGKA